MRGLRDGRSSGRNRRSHLAAEQPRHLADSASNESGDRWRDRRRVRRVNHWAQRLDSKSAFARGSCGRGEGGACLGAPALAIGAQFVEFAALRAMRRTRIYSLSRLAGVVERLGRSGNRSSFSATALTATMMLDPDMLSAATGGLMVNPCGSRTPAAIGIAALL